MAWYDTVGNILSKLDPATVTEVIGGMKDSNEMVAKVNILLSQVQRDPASASQVATAITTMDGVPGVVRDLASNLPSAARDQTGIALIQLVSQIQSALPRSRWF